ncbi:MAG: lysozyme inhibitor LprI family protein [Pikeienuella sp.]
MSRAGLALAGLLTAASAPAAADTLVEEIDACIGAIGAPSEHAEFCLGTFAQACLDKPENMSTAAMVSCVQTETDAWTAIMEREYAALFERLDDEQKAAMEDLQRKWIAFRQADCAFPRVFLRGSMALPWSADCVMQHTARRALDLRGYRGMLE